MEEFNMFKVLEKYHIPNVKWSLDIHLTWWSFFYSKTVELRKIEDKPLEIVDTTWSFLCFTLFREYTRSKTSW